MKFFLPDADDAERVKTFKRLLKRARGPRNLSICVDAVLNLTEYGFSEEEAKKFISIDRLEIMIDSMLAELDAKTKSRHEVKHSDASRLWRLVDGAVRDTFNQHPDYLTDHGRSSARKSIVKRVAGTIQGFAEQSAKSRSR